MSRTQSGSGDTVQEARRKARHRLVGAVVLLLAGIIGFPLVFETQPRPIPVDIVIEIPRKDQAPPLVAPAPRAAPPTGTGSAPGGAAAPSRTGESNPAGKAAPQSAAPSPAAAAAASGSGKGEPAQKATPAQAVSAPRAPVAVGKSESAVSPPARPKIGAPTPDTTDPVGTRFVVQIGAFADPSAAQLMRAKAEKLGLKTYTQVADTAAGDRVRVRIGPFATREAAELTLAKAKAGGLSAVVLTL